MLRIHAMRSLAASTSRKSSASAPGTAMRCQCWPPSVVRSTVPLAPLDHATVAETALTPRSRTATPLFCGTHTIRGAGAIATSAAVDASSERMRRATYRAFTPRTAALLASYPLRRFESVFGDHAVLAVGRSVAGDSSERSERAEQQPLNRYRHALEIGRGHCRREQHRELERVRQPPAVDETASCETLHRDLPFQRRIPP